MSIKIGSLFAGIGGFELGCERAWPNSKTIWQVEQNPFCQSILSKHWPKAKIYNDVRDITINNVEPVDVLLGGFPCQDISVAGQQKGVHDGKKSSLWWEMHRIISEIRPRVIIMENVANILRLGGADVIGSLAQIGYDCEWTVIRASDFGAPHQRARWFCVAYSNSPDTSKPKEKKNSNIPSPKQHETHSPTQSQWSKCGGRSSFHDSRYNDISNESSNSIVSNDWKRAKTSISMEERGSDEYGIGDRSQSLSTLWNNKSPSDWRGVGSQSAVCRMDDGIPSGMDRSNHKKIRKGRLQSLGNAIVPQCSQWIAEQVLQSGLLDDFLEGK